MTKQDYTPDWASIGPEYRWVAVDSDGEVFKYVYKPNVNGKFWLKHGLAKYIKTIPPPGENFINMIYERPDGR